MGLGAHPPYYLRRVIYDYDLRMVEDGKSNADAKYCGTDLSATIMTLL